MTGSKAPEILAGSVTIIGASLAGLSAARTLLSEKISDFKIVDAKEEIGYPLKCGEAVEGAAFDELYPQFSSATPAFIKNRIAIHRVFSKNVSRRFEARYYELDRPRFEKWLATPLQNKIHLNTRISSIEYIPKGFRLVSASKVFHSRAILLCCGATYQLHQKVGILKKAPPLGYAFGGVFPHPSSISQSEFLWDLLAEVEGYGWCFPKGDGTSNIGIAGYNAKAIRSCFENFRAKHQFSELPLCQLGGHFPGSGAIKKTVADGILVCGDAAGMVFAGTGEGISYALLSGKMAGSVMARALRENDLSRENLNEYETLWKNRFGKLLRLGVGFRQLLLFLERTDRMGRVLRDTPEAVFSFIQKKQRFPLGVLLHFACRRLFRSIPAVSSVHNP